MGAGLRKEGPIDFILAGLKGATGGIGQGLQVRQARLDKKSAAETQAEFRRTQLALQQQGIDIQNLGQELLAKNQEALISQRILDRESRISESELTRDARAGESELDRATRVQVAEIGAGKRELTPAEKLEAKLKNERAQQVIDLAGRTANREDKKHSLEVAKEKSKNDFSDRDYQFAIVEASQTHADNVLDNDTKVFLKRMDFLDRELNAEENELTPTEKFIIGRSWNDINEALENPSELNEKRANLAVEEVNKIIERTAPHLGKQPKLSTRQKSGAAKVVDFFDLFNILPSSGEGAGIDLIEQGGGEAGPQTLPQGAQGPLPVPLQTAQPRSEVTDPLESILGPIGNQPVAGPSLINQLLGNQQPVSPAPVRPQVRSEQNVQDAFAELDAAIDKIALPKQDVAEPKQVKPEQVEQEQVEKKAQQDIDSLVGNLRSAGKKTISDEFASKLAELGFSEQDIASIKKRIKIRPELREVSSVRRK